MANTLTAMQAGSFNVKVVALIEGCKYGLSDGPQASVQAALAGTDWAAATILPGLFLELHNEQSIRPWEAFARTGTCRMRVVDTDHTDVFGTFVHKRATGAETVLTQTHDRNDTTINVASTANFPISGEFYIGTECIAYTGKTSTSFTGCTRGKYSPFGCASSGSGGTRFGNHHRKGQDPNHVQLAPIASQLPRMWIGKRVGIWLHTWDDATQAMNAQAEAQLVFAGRIVSIVDDPETFHTVIELAHCMETDVRSAVIGKDMWSATLAEGMWLNAGRIFKFSDQKSGNAIRNANDLVVVSGTPANTQEIKEGYYSTNEICEALSAWLGDERTANRIYGFYGWHSPVTSNVGLRTKCYWKIEDASTISCTWTIEMPGEVSAFLGLHNETPGQTGISAKFAHKPWNNLTNQNYIEQGDGVPFVSMVFRPLGPGRLAQEFTEVITYEAENERGSFMDQYSLLPASVKASCDSTRAWGLFLLDEKVLMVGSYASGVLSQCWIAPFQLVANNDAEANGFMGRRADEPDGGPITLRQVLVLESTLADILLKLAYSSGTSGYNHSTYDTLGYGLGLNLPGRLLGEEFEKTVTNLPGAYSPIAVVIDEPTKFGELVHGDLLFRRSFVRWRDQHFEIAQWKTPVPAIAATSLAGATLTLEDANKAAPSGTQESHRIASLESAEHIRPIVKIDYCRDFASGRGELYLKSLMFEDQTAVDDAGGGVKPQTIEMRNTFQQFANTGSAVEALAHEYLAFMPVLARSMTRIERSIDQRYFEGYSVGDVAIVTDEHARDPLTGARGINSRAAFITKIGYDPGGPTWVVGGEPRSQRGSVELMFLDVHRGELYAPSAQVDDTQNAGGFSAGYNSGTSTLRCYAHKYSHVVSINKLRGLVTITEANDATRFVAGDKILIVEIDPANPASPTMWEREVASQSADDIALTSGLSSPAWDSAKKYRITYQKYSQVTTTQRDYSFQADDADEMVEDLEVPYHYAATEEAHTFTLSAGSGSGNEKGELVPNLCYGDGRPYDVGHERALIHTLNAYIDRKSAHQGAFLWSTNVSAGLIGNDNTIWNTLFAGPIFLGTEHLSGTVTRTLTVAPWFRSATGASAWIRVTLSRIKPQLQPAEVEGGITGGPYGDPIFTGEFSQTGEWDTSSTTWQTGADKTLSLGVKDLHFGFAWLVVEGAGDAQCRGLAKCIEGPRTVA